MKKITKKKQAVGAESQRHAGWIRSVTVKLFVSQLSWSAGYRGWKKAWGSSDKLSRQLPLLGFHCAHNKRDPRLWALALCVALSRSASFGTCDPSLSSGFHSYSRPQRQRPTHSPGTAAGGAAGRLWAGVWPMRDGAHGFYSLIQPGRCTATRAVRDPTVCFIQLKDKSSNLSVAQSVWLAETQCVSAAQSTTDQSASRPFSQSSQWTIWGT